MILETRVTVLREIAVRYHDLVDPMNGPGSIRGTGELVGGMPDTYTATVKEFERLLATMKYNRAAPLIQVGGGKHSLRSLRWHVSAWYIDARISHRHVPIPVKQGQKLKVVRDQQILKNKNGEWVPSKLVTQTKRLKGAREGLADAGLAWIAANWTLQSEPMLPQALLEAA